MYRISFWLQVGLVGLLGGCAGVLFHYALGWFVTIVWGVPIGGEFVLIAEQLPTWYVVALPAVGGLLVGVLLHFTRTPEVAGEGVPAVRKALVHDEAILRYRVAPLKLVATILTIGTGGSSGREGPIIQIGAALGSAVGQWRKVSKEERVILLTAGAVAAMAATFGTPVAALLFVVEVLRQRFTSYGILAVVLATALGVFVSKFVFGYPGLTFTVPAFQIDWLVDSVSLLTLIVTAGVVAVCFALTLATIRKYFIHLPLPAYVLPGLGGLLVGLLALYSPLLYEPAMYFFIRDLMMDVSVPALVILALLMLKVIATSITIGSGGAGGIFAPSLFLGALLGAGVVVLASLLGFTISPVYVAFGMVAVFAAAAHAPLTASFMLYEMTDSLLLFPIFLVVAYGSYFISKLISPTSMYDLDT